MESPGPLHPAIWVGFWLLLYTEAAAEISTMYATLNSPFTLRIPDYNVSGTDQMTWKEGSVKVLVKRKGDMSITYPEKGCELQPDGSLLLKTLERVGQINYTVEVHRQDGTFAKSATIHLIVMEPVSPPSLNYTCKNKKVEVQCSVLKGTESTIEIIGHTQKETSKSVKSLKSTFRVDKPVNVTCWASNMVNMESRTEIIMCSEGWDIYLILSVAGGGVAFLIFLVLLIYFVNKRVRSCQRRDDEETRDSRNIQARQLPEPPTQARAQIRAPPTPIENSPGLKVPPHERQPPPVPQPHNKRSNHKRPPQDQTEKVPLQERTMTTPSQIPALPSNHPSGQPPKPHPRNQSKPQRQHRKKN
ncbi:T-cell surface antigen CD2 [Discoglossus pictus]